MALSNLSNTTSVEDLIQLIGNMDVDIKAAEEFEFAGFDLDKIRQKFSALNIDESTKFSLIRDCAYQVCLRGTSLKKQAEKKSNKGSIELLKQLNSLHIPIITNDPEILSMTKIAHLGAYHALKLFAKDMRFNKFYDSTNSLPVYYQCSLAPSYLPDNASFNLWCQWSDKFSSVINSSKSIDFKRQAAERSKIIGNIAFNNQHISLAIRTDTSARLKAMFEQNHPQISRLVLQMNNPNVFMQTPVTNALAPSGLQSLDSSPKFGSSTLIDKNFDGYSVSWSRASSPNTMESPDHSPLSKMAKFEEKLKIHDDEETVIKEGMIVEEGIKAEEDNNNASKIKTKHK